MSVSSSQETFQLEEQSLTVADRIEELALDHAGFPPCRWETLYPLITGWGWKKDMKLRHGWLKQSLPKLQKCLHPGEEILYVSRGTRYSVFEFLLMGVWANYINQNLLVVTNIRVLIFHCNGKGLVKNTSWMIFYHQIKKISPSLVGGTLTLVLQDGRKLQIVGMKKADRKRLPQIIRETQEICAERGFCPEGLQSLERLCSHCLKRMPAGEYFCPHCGGHHWPPGEIAWRSFVFPSWGDFVMGHNLLALMECIGGIFVWGLLFVGLLGAFVTGDIGMLIGVLIVFMVANGIDAIITSHIARKGLHPRGTTPLADGIEPDGNPAEVPTPELEPVGY